jgi:H/ACA ribonucleoprotein complex subunit 2
MAKDKSTSEKKDKKEKRKSVDANGVKKEKKEKPKSDATAAAISEHHVASPAPVVDADGDVIVDVEGAAPLGALVPFANPLCDEKATKKVLKTVKKGEFLSPIPPSQHKDKNKR